MAKKIVLGFGIALVFAAVVHYGICTLFPEPKWNDYQIKGYYHLYKKASEIEKDKLEKMKIEKNDLYKKHNEEWAIKYFYIGLPAGVIAVILGAVIPMASIGSGMLGGGIIVLMFSYGNYWMHMPDLSKFLSLCAVLLLLIWVGYRKVEKNS